MNRRTGDFNSIFIASLQEAMGKALGRWKAEVILNHIKKIGGLDLSDIPEKLSDFDVVLKALLGEEGGIAIENMIIEEVYSRIGVRPEIRLEWGFPEYIEHAKMIYITKERIGVE